MGFDREGKKTARRKHARDRRQDRAQIVDINEHVGGEHEVIFRGIAGLAGKKVDKVGGDEAVINAFRRGLRDHRRRKIDADQPIDAGAKSGAGEPGAAAEIEHRSESAAAVPAACIACSTASRSIAGPR